MSTFVFVGGRGTTRALYRRSLDALQAEQIPGTEGGASPAISPDGRSVGFDADGQLKKAPLAGGPLVTIANIGGALASATWVSGPGIVMTSRTIVSRGAADADLNSGNVNWDVFPDGRMLFIDLRGGGGQGTRRIVMIQNWPALARQMGAKQ